MIYIDIEGKEKTINNRKKALAFMYMMKRKGYIVLGYRCDDNDDKEWLDKRIKL